MATRLYALPGMMLSSQDELRQAGVATRVGVIYLNIDTGIEAVEAAGVAAGIGSAVAAGESFDHLIPAGDIALDGWTDQTSGVVDIFQAIDELAADDGDYVHSPAVVGVSATFKVRLYKDAAQIVEWVHADIPETFTEVEQTLTEAQVAAIGGFTDLFVEFDDNLGNVYRFALADAVGIVDEPVSVTYRYKKLAA